MAKASELRFSSLSLSCETVCQNCAVLLFQPGMCSAEERIHAMAALSRAGESPSAEPGTVRGTPGAKDTESWRGIRRHGCEYLLHAGSWMLRPSADPGRHWPDLLHSCGRQELCRSGTYHGGPLYKEMLLLSGRSPDPPGTECCSPEAEAADEVLLLFLLPGSSMRKISKPRTDTHRLLLWQTSSELETRSGGTEETIPEKYHTPGNLFQAYVYAGFRQGCGRGPRPEHWRTWPPSTAAVREAIRERALL